MALRRGWSVRKGALCSTSVRSMSSGALSARASSGSREATMVPVSTAQQGRRARKKWRRRQMQLAASGVAMQAPQPPPCRCLCCHEPQLHSSSGITRPTSHKSSGDAGRRPQLQGSVV